MFGNKKPVDMEQSLGDGHAALLRIAQHVGIDGGDGMPPDALAAAICSSIDALTGQPPSTAGSEIRPIPASVRRVKLRGAVDIVLNQGAEPKMEVFANNAAYLPKILTTVSDDCLTVDNQPVTIFSQCLATVKNITGRIVVSGDLINRQRGPSRIDAGEGHDLLRVEVTLPDLCCLRLSGAGNITYRGIDQKELDLDISGAGDIEVEGKVDRLEARVSGAGKISAYALRASQGRLRLSGTGKIEATVITSVDARMSGVGKIKIDGNPLQRDTAVSGIGKITFVDPAAP